MINTSCTIHLSQILTTSDFCDISLENSCTIFIDDLPELLLALPTSIKRIQFSKVEVKNKENPKKGIKKLTWEKITGEILKSRAIYE